MVCRRFLSLFGEHMIAAALRVEIERYAASARTSNAMYVAAESGAMTFQHIDQYLRSVGLLTAHSVEHLTAAASKARDRGDCALADHFEKKALEECGHEVWAESDVRSISRLSRLRSDTQVAESIHKMVAFVEETIDEDPTLYLAYILFAEYLVVLLGDDWLALLDARCGIPRTSMTFVANHADLDRDHTEEALDMIDALVGDPTKLSAMRDTVRATIRIFDSFCEEITSKGYSCERSSAA